MHNLSEMLVTASLATDCEMCRYACALLFCKREFILDSELLVLKSYLLKFALVRQNMYGRAQSQ
jgi:hypothetical protein